MNKDTIELIKELEKLKQYVDEAGTYQGVLPLSPFQLDTVDFGEGDNNSTIYQREVSDYLTNRIADLKSNKE